MVAGAVAAEEISIVAVGDITIGSGLTPTLEKQGISVLFAGTRNLITSADIATASLNTSISDRGEPRYGIKHTFRAIPDLAQGLANSGFKVVSLATPHLMDFGLEALEDTIYLLESCNVKPVGAALTSEAVREPVWIRAKTAWVAFLAYYRTNQFGDTDDPIAYAVFGEMTESVKRVAAQAELVVVWLHWGKGRTTQTVSSRQRLFAQGLIDAGADLVLCQQLHTLQGTEIRHGKPIIYSLSDFIYERYDKQNSRVVIPKVTFVGDALKSIELTPIWTDNPNAKYQPQILGGEAAQDALVNYQILCAELATEVVIEGDRGWITPKVEAEEKHQ